MRHKFLRIYKSNIGTALIIILILGILFLMATIAEKYDKETPVFVVSISKVDCSAEAIKIRNNRTNSSDENACIIALNFKNTFDDKARIVIDGRGDTMSRQVKMDLVLYDTKGDNCLLGFWESTDTIFRANETKTEDVICYNNFDADMPGVNTYADLEPAKLVIKQGSNGQVLQITSR